MAINRKQSAPNSESPLYATETAKSCLPSDGFISISKRYMEHQKPKITAESYRREEGIIAQNLAPFFGEERPVAAISQLDIRGYVESRNGYVSAASIRKEWRVLKHL